MTIRKWLLCGAALSLTTFTYAQKSNVRKANRELQDAQTAMSSKNQAKAMLALSQAKAAIDTAAVNSDTKNDAKTWFTKAAVYSALQGNSALNSGRPYIQSYFAINKAIKLDSRYATKSEALSIMKQTAFYAFNFAAQAFNKSNYDSSVVNMGRALDLLGKAGGKRFADDKSVDTIRAQANMISGYSYYYLKDYNKAIPLLKACTESPYLTSNKANIYLILAQAYGKQNDPTNQIATIEAGVKKFPTNDNLKNAEISYYLDKKDTKKLVKKFKDRVASDPNNAKNYFDLGIIYDQMANTPDSSVTEAQREEWATDAEKALKKALDLDGNNPEMNYQLGAHYYNQAAAVNNILSQMSGMNQTKYQKVLKTRNDLFSKAVPLFEKAKSIFKSESSSLSNNDRNYYIQTLQALAKIYAIQNKLDKAKENRTLLNSL